MAFGRKDRKDDGVVHDAVRMTEPSKHASEVAGMTYEAVAEPELVAPQAVIGPTICIKGDVTGDEDLLVEGRVEGTVSLPKSRLVVGPNGHVAATIKSRTLHLEGHIDGDIQAGESVVLTSSGKMQGNIKAPRVTLQDGCKFKGSIEMDLESHTVVTDLKPPHAKEPPKPSTDQRAS
jgi:cytoskeletal protein CcmA (bactofilin family)